MDRDREDELAAQATALGIDVRALADVVAKLASRSTVAELAAHTVRRMRMLVAALALLCALGIVLTGYVVWNNARITAVQERTSNEVLCPLYDLFLRSYRPEVQPPERRADYEASFEVIRHSYAVLECAPKPEG
jgi:hypothetical protein